MVPAEHLLPGSARPELSLIEVAAPLKDRAVALQGLRAGERAMLARHIDSEPVGKVLHSLDIAQAVVPHQEGEDVSLGLAAEAVVDLLCLAHVE